MKAWIYCLVKEQYSCQELGYLRRRCIEFARKRRMVVTGISSVNIFDGDYHFTSTLDDAINHKAEVLVIANLNLLPHYKRTLLSDICRKNGITIIPYKVDSNRD